jgi:hypothetical protein
VELTKQQREALTRALAKAFPSAEDLDVLTQFKLGVRLNQISEPNRHQTLVLRVVNWVEAHDKLFPDLIVGALNQNAENDDLQQVARDYGLDEGAGEFEARILKEVSVSDVETWRAKMMRCERAVCRVELRGESNGTGFLIGKDQVITNHHVLDPVWSGDYTAAEVGVRFDFKLQKDGKRVQDGVEYSLVAGDSWYEATSEDRELDYVILRLAKRAADGSISGQPGAPIRGFLEPIAWQFNIGQPLFIIQHPDGSPLKFAAGSITADPAKPDRVAHNVTTERGSSGSPCFTSDWKVVALHHWGRENDHNRAVTFSAILNHLAQQGVQIRK